MENRNILMVILSFSLFLVVVIGIALLITWPKDGLAKAGAPQVTTQFLSWSRGGQPTATPEEQITGFLPTGSQTPSPTMSSGIVIEVHDQDTDNSSASSLIHRATEEVPRRTMAQLAVQTRPPKPPDRTTIRKVTAPPKHYPQRVTEYWIQSGSFKSRSSAELQNEKLAEKGFAGQVKTRLVGETTYYRVRIGPYTNKKEAGKFLAWIKELPEMNESYISESYVIR